MKETRRMEFKSEISDTFLKTVSAFANYDGGRILFGYDDNGRAVGLEDPEQACLNIENKINDSIRPQPDYELSIQESSRTVILTVEGGPNKPYTYRSKAYRRKDTATIEVDELELARLVLQGKNVDYEELPAEDQELTFSSLEKKAKEETGIESLNIDILKTLDLYSDAQGYNRAAELLADKNEYPGIDIIRFGDDINTILKEKTIQHQSILTELEKAISMYRDYYQYEEINGSYRQNIELIPEAAFREAVANALMHRTWNMNAQIRILMFDDRVEITWPGGLLAGLSEEEYLKGNFSVLRNPILGNIFYRLHLVEILGTGVRRIRESYRDSASKPEFEVFENSIKVTLPVMNVLNLSEDEDLVYKSLSKTIPRSSGEITEAVPFGKSKTTAILKKLVKNNYVTVVGRGRGTKYKL